jgi:hypothetical protein
MVFNERNLELIAGWLFSLLHESGDLGVPVILRGFIIKSSLIYDQNLGTDTNYCILLSVHDDLFDDRLV